MERQIKEAINQALPYNSNCPLKKLKVDWQREKLFNRIIQIINDRNNQPSGQQLPGISSNG